MKEFSISLKSILTVAGVGLALLFLWTIRDILILLLISITLASALEPLVDFFSERKVPRAVSVLSVYIIAIAVVGFTLYLVVPTMASQFQQFTQNGPQLTADFQNKLNGNSVLRDLHIGDSIVNGFHSFGKGVNSISGSFLNRTIGLFNGFIEVITVLVVSFYLVAERNGMKHFVYTLVPDKFQDKTLEIITKIQRKIGRWMIGQFIISAAVFLLVYAMLSLFGVNYALILAILAAVLEFIPFIGPIMFAVPGILVAFIQDPGLALIVALGYLLIQKVEGYVLVPKIMQRTVGLSPLVILVAILVGLKVAGILGVFLAVPIASALEVSIKEWRTE